MVRFHPPAPGPITPSNRPQVPSAVAAVLDREAPSAGERWLVAFSGGPDSTALAAALARLAGARELEVVLAHVDHGADPGSAARAARAAELAAELALPFRLARLDVPGGRWHRESPEAAARRLRYAALEGLRQELGAARILTAHHRDDQLETVLLRLLRRAPVEGLGGIAPRRGALLRPLLEVARADIEAYLGDLGLVAVSDPTNLDLGLARNRLRHALLPRLRASEPDLEEPLLALARRSAALGAALDRRFSSRFPAAGEADLERLVELPEALQLPALRWFLHERLGAERLPSLPALRAFLSAARRGATTARLALPGGRTALVARRGELRVEVPESRIPPFSYTFSIPGEVELQELGLRLRIRRSPVEPWMFHGDPRRAGLVAAATRATVRSRRPGDRLHPLGSPGSRKLKAILIDRRVAVEWRDRMPLLELAGRLAWVPGVTLDRRFAIGDEGECWLAELEPLPSQETGATPASERTAH